MNRILRKSLYFIVPLIVCLSITGTGFCFWIFDSDHQSDPKEANISINIASATTSGAFDTRSLITDTAPLKIASQGYAFPKMLVFDEGKRGGNPLAQGLSFYKELKNLKEPGKENIFETTYPVFNKENFLSDTVLLTYYRDATISLEDLKAGGLSFVVDIEITITSALSKFITVFDTYDLTSKTDSVTNNVIYTLHLANLFDLDKENPVNSGLFYNNLIKESLGYKTKESAREPLTKPDLDINLQYEKRNYTLNFSQLFRWTSRSVMPLNPQQYSAIRNLCDLNTESISFSFIAGYKEIEKK